MPLIPLNYTRVVSGLSQGRIIEGTFYISIHEGKKYHPTIYELLKNFNVEISWKRLL